MEIEEKNGVTRYFDFEIDKALKQKKYGVPIADFFRIEAKAYRYGKIGYLGKLKEELENFEEQPVIIDDLWDYQIECVEELKKAILDLQELNIQPPAKQSKTNLKNEYRFNTELAESVPDLFDELLKRKMITGNKDHFIWAFGIGKDKPTDFKQLVWNGENTLLAYLINEVCTNRKKWEVAKMIFGVKRLAQTFKNCKGNPRGKEIIDSITLEIG